MLCTLMKCEKPSAERDSITIRTERTERNERTDGKAIVAGSWRNDWLHR